MTSNLEVQFAQVWVELYPDIDLHSEYKFHPARRFRLDFAHLPSKTGIEINGGVWVKSKHSSGVGIQRDYEKQLIAASIGWVILPLSAASIQSDAALKLVRQAIELRMGSHVGC